jgi:hypothetical protein
MRPRVAALMGAPLLVLALSGAAPAGAAEPPPAVPVLQPLLDAWRQLRVWAGDVLPLADREGRFGPLVDSNARQAAAAQRVAGPVGMLAGRDDLRAAQARAAAARRHACLL